MAIFSWKHSFLILNNKKTRIYKIFDNFNFIPISLTILFLWQVFLYKFGFYITSIITSTCTSLILLSLNKKFTNILLNLKFLIFSGKISFPLILFHMPIIYFLNLFIINKLAVVILTFLLSYFFSILIFKIKIKLTSVKFDRYKKKIYSLVSLILVLNIVLFMHYINNKYYFSYKEYDLINIIKSNYNYQSKIKETLFLNPKNKLNDKIIYGSDGEDCFGNSNSISNCIFNKNGLKEHIYLIGGSNGANLSANLVEFFTNLDHPYTSITHPMCTYMQNYNKINKFTNEIDGECNSEKFLKIKQKILSNKNSIIIITGRYQMIESGTYYEDGEGNIEGKIWKYQFIKEKNKINQNFTKDLVKEINELAKFNKIILIYPFPEFAVNIVKRKLISPEAVVSSSYLSYQKRSKTLLRTLTV